MPRATVRGKRPALERRNDDRESPVHRRILGPGRIQGQPDGAGAGVSA